MKVLIPVSEYPSVVADYLETRFFRFKSYVRLDEFALDVRAWEENQEHDSDDIYSENPEPRLLTHYFGEKEIDGQKVVCEYYYDDGDKYMSFTFEDGSRLENHRAPSPSRWEYL